MSASRYGITRRVRLGAAVAALVLCGALYFIFLAEPDGTAPLAPPAVDGPPAAGMDSEPPKASPPAASPPPPARRAEISGVVSDTAGGAIIGALVILAMPGTGGTTAPGPDLFRVETGGNGGFTVPVPAAGERYHLRAERFGYRMASVHGAEGRVLAVPADGLEDVELVMARCGAISGRVVNVLGEPVPGMRLLAGLVEAAEIVQASVQDTATSDSKGRFSLSGLTGGDYALWGRYSAGQQSGGRATLFGSYDSPLMRLQIRGGEWRENVIVEVPLDPRRAIEGIVVDEKGAPVAGATVLLPGMGAASDTTLADGRFRIEGILTHHPRSDEEVHYVAVRAECEGYEPAELRDVPVGTRTVRITLPRRRRGVIAVLLTDADTGDKITNAEVFWWQSEAIWGETLTNQSVYVPSEAIKAMKTWTGWFMVEDVPAGKADLLIVAQGYGIRQESGIAVHDGETTEAEIALKAAGLLCVRGLPVEASGWLLAASHALVWPEAEYARDHPAAKFQPQVNCPLDCGHADADAHFHKDFCLSPGNYEVMSVATLVRGSDNGRPAEYVSWNRTASHTVRAGAITYATVRYGNGGYGAVVLRGLPQWTDKSALYLLRGPYSGFLELPPAQRGEAFAGIPEFQRTAAKNGEAVFPIVAPGQYTLVFSSYVGVDHVAAPALKEVRVRAGETAAVTLE